MSDLTKLAERVEAATGSDVELDLDISEATKAWQRLDSWKAFRPTGSLDAAMSLVPEGAFWSITMRGVRRGWFQAACATEEGRALDWREAATAALALTAACLRARANQEHQ